MDWFRKIIQYYLDNHKKLGRWRKVVSIMAAIVVFATTYALILPAITVDKESSTPETGMYLENGKEESKEEKVEEKKKEEDSKESSDKKENEDSDSKDKSAPEATTKEEAKKEDATTEKSTESDDKKESEKEDSDKKDSDSSEAKKDTDEKKSDSDDKKSEEDKKKAEDGEDKFESGKLEVKKDEYKVFLTYKEGAKIPEGAKLSVKELKKGSDDYEKYLKKVRKNLDKKKKDRKLGQVVVRFFDISIMDGDKEIQPKDEVDVQIKTDPMEVEDPDDVQAVHFDSDKEEVKTVETDVNETKKGVDSVSFDTKKATVYGIIYNVDYLYRSYTGDDYKVILTYDEDAGIPASAELKVKEYGDSSKKYKEYLSKAEKKLGKNEKIKYARFFDISIMDGENEFKPEAPVDVKVELDEKVPGDVNVERLGEKAEIMDADVKEKDGEETVSFTDDGMPVYGIVGTETIEKTVLASDGHNYKITATYDSDSGIPEDADLFVEEITKKTNDYRLSYGDYTSLVEEALGIEKGTASYIRLFNIKIVDKDDSSVKYQPAKGTKVDVKIELADSNSEKLQVVHIADGANSGDVVKAKTENGDVKFSADGFSVYAVVDEPIIADESRMTLNFYNGENLIATVYVKNGDKDPAEIEKIIFDPGCGTLGKGELFKGWILDKENYDTNDVADKMDVAEIRTWALEKATNNQITEDEVHNFYAMIYKTFSVAYKDESGTTIHSEALIFTGDSTDYTINQPYTPKEQDSAFQGWYWTNADGTVTDPLVAKDGSTAPFANGTEVTIKDNITFTVNVPKGFWLSFVENGDGASYTPPQFIANNSVTSRPDDPKRLGYIFTGWNTKADGSGDTWLTVTYNGSGNPTYSNDRFGSALGSRTTLYAQWTPVQTANYTVVIWRQNLTGDGYDFEESITLNGNVGSTINTVQPQGQGNGRYARINNVNKQYTGFRLEEYDQNVNIVPEGTSVVNVYYDRIEYTVRFYYARTPNNNNSRAWSVATAISTNQELQPFTNRTTWTNTNQNRTSYGPSTQYQLDGANRYYYFTITALYGQDISEKWPRYDSFPDLGNYQLISWWMMHNATSWGGAGGGKDTVKGIISIMDEQLLGDTTSSDGNFLIARYSNSQPNVYNYKIWKELPDGFAVPTNQDGTPKQTKTMDGVRYFLDDTLIAKANSDPGGIHQPSYKGFTEDGFTYSVVQNYGGGRYEYDVEMYYSRNKFKINYMDGLYYNGNNVILDDNTGFPLSETDVIYYESDIHSYNKGGSNYYEPSKTGYVFAGWYTDKACQNEMEFSEVPDHNVTVYAKWMQKQYRVFLHPNVPTSDTSFDMGGQATSFRVDYGNKVAGGNQISGTRDEYDLIGWYTDEACTQAFNFDAYVLNDTTVTTQYDKTEDTELDKYGNVKPGEQGNKDASGNRYWISRKLDLYAKWRARIEGANGINVIYDAGAGSNAPEDPLIYLDNSEATAGAASTPNDSKKQFMYWVIQTWDGEKYVDTEETVYPGDIYTVLKANAKPIVTEWVNPDDDEDVLVVEDPQPGTVPPDDTHTKIKTATYTVQLRAEYDDKSAPTPTHIDWYPNYGEEATHSPILRELDLQINKAVPICEAPTREGYKFLGWARIPTTQSQSTSTNPPTAKILELTKDDLFLTYHEGSEGETGYYTASITSGGVTSDRTVTKVAADEVTPYHDMYAVWERVCTVTVKKVVVGTAADKNINFSFAPKKVVGDETTEGEDYNFTLKDGGSKEIFDDLPLNSVFSVTEIASDEYDINDYDITVTGKYTDDENVSHDIENLVNGSDVTIQGDTEITVTNTRKAKTVRILKVDDSEEPVPLENVEFTLNGETLVTGEDGYTDTIILNTSATPYSLEETKPLPNYKGLSAAVSVTVSAADVTIPTGIENVTISGPDNNGVYTITVVNPLKDIPLKVVKTDQGGVPLAGAAFTGDLIEGGSITTVVEGEGDEAEAIIINNDKVSLGNYTIRETNPPKGYNLLEGSIVIEVSANQTTGQVIVTPTINNEESAFAKAELIDSNHPELGWKVIISNDAGEAFPNTGGPGTFLYTLSGLMLILLSALMYGFRLRRRERRLNE